MKNIPKILALVVLAAILLSSQTYAAQEDNFVYLFHLYYENGTLVVDRDAENPYELLSDIFEQPFTGASPYSGKVVSAKGQQLATFKFDVAAPGKVSAKGPYYANADHVDFISPAGAKLLTVSVAASSFCNDDAVCNKEVGENDRNCPNDCTVIPVPISSSPTPTPVVTEGSSTPFIGAFLYLFLGVGLVVGMIIFFKRRGKATLPPTPPSVPPPASSDKKPGGV